MCQPAPSNPHLVFGPSVSVPMIQGWPCVASRIQQKCMIFKALVFFIYNKWHRRFHFGLLDCSLRHHVVKTLKQPCGEAHVVWNSDPLPTASQHQLASHVSKTIWSWMFQLQSSLQMMPADIWLEPYKRPWSQNHPTKLFPNSEPTATARDNRWLLLFQATEFLCDLLH